MASGRRRGGALVEAAVAVSLLAVVVLVAIAVWTKSRGNSIAARAEQVETGMSKAQVIELLGEPKRSGPIIVDMKCPNIPQMYKRGKMEECVFADDEAGLFGRSQRTIYFVAGSVVPEPDVERDAAIAARERAR